MRWPYRTARTSKSSGGYTEPRLSADFAHTVVSMPRKLNPVTGKMMHLVRTPDAGLYDPSHSWFDGSEYVAATETEIDRYFPDPEQALG